MSIIGTIISVMLMTLILNIVFKKFNILIDQTGVSSHKSFISGHKTIPLSGGLVFFLVLIFFFTRELQIFKYIIFFYLFNRFIIRSKYFAFSNSENYISNNYNYIISIVI